MVDTTRRFNVDELAAEALPLVRWQARRFPKLPEGCDVEDLESVGHEAIMEAITTYDPACGVAFRTAARTTIRSRMQDCIRAARARAKGRVSLQADRPDGTTAPLPADTRTNEPGDIAAAREMVVRRSRTMTAKSVEQSIPSPQAVAEKVVALRAAMFDAIDTAGITDVMTTLMKNAKAGDLKATKLLLDLLAPKMSGVTVNHRSIGITTVEDLA